jgi:hypothetical protein
MKRSLLLFSMLGTAICMSAQNKMNMTIGSQTVTVSLESNSATEALVNHLQNGDVTVNTSRYGGFEQVGNLPWSLPASNNQITTQPGDVILYNGNQLVVFFGSNSWSYTRLGRIEGMSQSELNDFLNVSSCRIILSLPNTTGIKDTKADALLDSSMPMYNLSGQRMNISFKGVVVQNGRKYKKR